MSKASIVPGFDLAEILMLTGGVLVIAAIVYVIWVCARPSGKTKGMRSFALCGPSKVLPLARPISRRADGTFFHITNKK
jgi:hypothetical protein